MAGSRLNRVVALMAVGSLVVSSTAAAAASTPTPAQQEISPWATMAFLTGGAPAVAVCGAAAAAAAAAVQPGAGCVLPVMDAPPPPPLPPPAPVPAAEAVGGYGITPMLAGLLAVVAGIGLFLLVKGHQHHEPVPISPV